MKLKTSYFNIRVLLKNLSRFAPVWILYSVAEVLGLLSLDLANSYRIVDDLSYIMGPISIFHGIYAMVVASCLFGDLFDSRICNGLHAMPMRREGWLITNLLSGLVFALIPALVGGGFAAFVLKEYWWIALVWQAVSLLQFVFFFGVAVFSAMCAGKRLGMIAIYAIFNFLSMLIFWIATMIYEPMLPGVMLSDDWFTLFCPVVSMVGDTYFDINITYTETSTTAVFEGYNPEAWIYLLICTGIGLVFTILAWLLYRKRHLETAGDFISFRPMRLFFLLAYTFAAGAFVYSFGDLFGIAKSYGFLVVGILIGFFTGWMLLERTVKIFTKKVLLGFVAFAVLFAASLGIAAWDPLGIASYVPEPEKVESACMYLQQDRFHYESNDLAKSWYVTDPAEIARIGQLHGQMTEAQEQTEGEFVTVYVRYDLKNGFHVYRSYQVPTQTQLSEELGVYFSDLRSVLGTGDMEKVKDNLLWANIYLMGGDVRYELTDPQQLQQLFAAMEADSAAGKLAQHDYFHVGQEYVAGIDLTWERTLKGRSDDVVKESYSIYLSIYEDCQHIRAFWETLDEIQ